MPGQNLTKEEAAARSRAVTVYDYDIHLDLTGDDKTFQSTSTVQFDIAGADETFLDLIADEVTELTVNGEARPVDSFSDSRVHLTGLKDKNTVTIQATCRYMHTGEGLHRFTDPADGLDYCYSQFEVPDSRRVFAVFEQPDMKAQFTFHVRTPSEWVVFSNSPTPTPREENGSKVWDFSASEQISSYITAIVAGPYVGKTGTLTSADGRTIDLGVYCRQSLLEHLDAEWVMDVTRAGFKFFEREYGRAYPFRKYDQIFVPEYNAGAMENAGCVTFRDEYVYRSKPTAAQLENLANTVLHELAHMWFGDLVTMQWWNDLWLNESFAEFMSHLCLAEGTEQWQDAWTGFMARKDWGLTQDQLPSTHPIVAPIRDLEDVEVNFDGITYAKGAAVLRQLVSYVGRDQFFEGLRAYIAEHAWKNTTLPDLMGKLEAASGRDLRGWAKVWLEEAGVTLLSPVVETSEAGKIVRLAVKQEPFTPGSSLRPHRLAVAGYSLVDGQVQQVFHEELDVEGDETPVESAVGLPRPDLILVNDGDLAYAKIRLDEQSLAFATEHIAQFPSSLTRGVVLASAWDMVRDAQMPARQYIDMALSALTGEDSMMILNLLLRHINTAVSLYLPTDEREEVANAVAQRLLLLARSAAAGTDAQRLLTAAAAARATKEQAGDIENLRTGKATLVGLPTDADMRWTLLLSSVRNGVAGETQIAQMTSTDQTLTGAQKAAQARASVAEQGVKDKAFKDVVFDRDLSNDMRIALGRGYWANAIAAPELYRAHVPQYFDALREVWELNTNHTAQDIVLLGFPTMLAGRLADLDVVKAGYDWLDANEDAPAGLRRLVSEETAEAERAVKAQLCR
ncbi:aminopeptidase N [Gleimia hominis]|uniref:aminopeptidase N n=1 Tax=Gleimia hominis TaxID=595468 RepID=UPI000C7F9FBD|nr:aminopeptidase N [Gleimia hominis]WIK64872.1 aminopeptidase N [Gleimia hominis]